MITVEAVARVGEMPQRFLVGAVGQVGARDAKGSAEGQPGLVRRPKQGGCCKTCSGRGCVGRCKF